MKTESPFASASTVTGYVGSAPSGVSELRALPRSALASAWWAQAAELRTPALAVEFASAFVLAYRRSTGSGLGARTPMAMALTEGEAGLLSAIVATVATKAASTDSSRELDAHSIAQALSLLEAFMRSRLELASDGAALLRSLAHVGQLKRRAQHASV